MPHRRPHPSPRRRLCWGAGRGAAHGRLPRACHADGDRCRPLPRPVLARRTRAVRSISAGTNACAHRFPRGFESPCADARVGGCCVSRGTPNFSGGGGLADDLLIFVVPVTTQPVPAEGAFAPPPPPHPPHADSWRGWRGCPPPGLGLSLWSEGPNRCCIGAFASEVGLRASSAIGPAFRRPHEARRPKGDQREARPARVRPSASHSCPSRCIRPSSGRRRRRGGGGVQAGTTTVGDHIRFGSVMWLRPPAPGVRGMCIAFMRPLKETPPPPRPGGWVGGSEAKRKCVYLKSASNFRAL